MAVHSCTMRVFRNKYLDYSRYIKASIVNRERYNKVTPVGLTIKEIYELSQEFEFKVYAKRNKNSRFKLKYRNKDKYEKILLLRNILNNRKDLTVTAGHNLKYFRVAGCNLIPLSPLLKWPGGKTREIRNLYLNSSYLLPDKINNFYEPFLGGGAFYFSIKAKNYFINDKSNELIDFYKLIKSQDLDFFFFLDTLTIHWIFITSIIKDYKEKIIKNYSENTDGICDLIPIVVNNFKEEVIPKIHKMSFDKYRKILKLNIISKIKKMKKLEVKKGLLKEADILSNIEGAYKSSFYTYLRGVYNKNILKRSYQIGLFYFFREYCYSSMFRYNSNGEFNVPYGGLSYNRKNPNWRFNHWRDEEVVDHLGKAIICNLDFETFLEKHTPQENDFIFVDPPYDTTFSTYANNIFAQQEHIRLAAYLVEKCNASWMVIIKNTDFIYSLYNKKGIRIVSCDKKYAVSFMNRNDKFVDHLVITNY